MKRGKVICIGDAVVDVLVAHLPPNFLEHDVTDVQSIQYETGGDAANEAVILSRLGHQSSLISMIGQDMLGDFVLSRMKENHVDTRFIIRPDQIQTTTSLVLIHENGERNFVANRGGNAYFKNEYVNLDALQNADVISIASFFTNQAFDDALPDILKQAKQIGAMTTGDMLYREGYTLEKAKDYLHYFDFVFPNYEEAAQVTQKKELGDIASEFQAHGVKNVIIKIGARGCYIQTASESFIVPAYQGATMVDSTGAGDNFAAGFIAALIEGKTIREAAAYANAAAAVSIQSIGALGLQNRQQVMDMMKNEWRQPL